MGILRWTPVALAAVVLAGGAQLQEPDVLIADFEGRTYGDWQATGEAFGSGPAAGTLPGQQPVTGFMGQWLVNSFLDGDRPQGTLTSPALEIRRDYLNLLVGGGDHPGETCVNLIVDGRVVRSETGTASTGADDEHLSWRSWDVAELRGQEAHIEIVDRHSGSWGHINVDHLYLSNERRQPLYANPAITRSMSSVEGARARAERDPTRPVYHFRPPALWMNDPNGPIFHGGFYHLFYQHNPYGDRWQHMHWGHARSHDLVHWEHLPIALWPSSERGEEHCFSGCAAVNDLGEVMLLYTSIGPERTARDGAEQWAAVARDDELLVWDKHPRNPILTERLHGEEKIYDWRDPFVFRHEGETYMVLGGNLDPEAGGRAIVALYRACNAELTDWDYLGILFQHPDREVRNIECPNFFPLGDKWVLIVSPHRQVEYFVGEFDTEAHRFVPESRGVLDFGNFYAPNGLEDPSGRRILWGWVNGFEPGRGWNGCLTLPRVLTVRPDGLLGQAPAPELQALRGEHYGEAQRLLDDGTHALPIEGDALEIVVEFELPQPALSRQGEESSGGTAERSEVVGESGDARRVGLRVRCSEDRERAVTIAFDGRRLDVAGMAGDFTLLEDERVLRLHVFVDRAVTEVYANGRACITRVMHADPADTGVELFADGGRATVRRVDVWRLRCIW